jgi:K+-sensing histidine kinase KdpD
MPKSPTESEEPSVAWPDMVKFVRQLSHDIRNHLNAVELQSSYLGELVEDDEIKNEIKRLRQMISEIGTSLQRLTAGLAQNNPNMIPYRAVDFVEDLQQKIANEFGENSGKISWDVQVENASLKIDPQLVQQAVLELFANAFQHERNFKSINAKIYIDNGRFVLELREPKSKFEASTANWGREPLRNVSQGHYGLGLNRARSIAEAHGGGLGAEYDRKSSTLVSKLSLPIDRATT